MIRMFPMMLLSLVFILSEGVHATPDRHIYSIDRLLGSNLKSYAILRTQYDNKGSHHVMVLERSLLIFSKEPEDPKEFNKPGPMLTKKLLLEQTITDPSMVAKGKSNITFDNRDDSVSFASLLEEYPMMPMAWPKEKVTKLHQESTSGVTMPGTSLIWGGYVKERFGVDRNAKFEWRLDRVLQDGNSIFLQVTGFGDIPDQRIIALSPRKSRQVRDHLNRQDLYLVAGTHDSLGEAMKQAQSMKKGREFVLGFEVWSMSLPTDQTKYVVVDVNSTKHLRKPGQQELESRTGLDLTVLQSGRFVERFVVEAAPDK